MKHFNCLFLNQGSLPLYWGIMVLISLVLSAPLLVAQTYPQGFSQVEVASGINNPTVMAFAPDGRIFVAEQGGTLYVIKNGMKLSNPALQLTVNSSGERGLIGIALHPNFATNGYVYLYYTLANGSRNRVSRFTMSGDVINPASETVILNLDPLSSATNHNGGAMHFKGDKLYVAIGENANPSHAQNLDTYHGKILRINADGSAPSDNPFYSASATEQRKRVWAYGLRNPYTFDVQANTGKIYVNDVGQNTWEEINDATNGGLNFGWPATEGPTTNPAYTAPVYAYQHGSGDGRGCAITGGVFFDPSSTNYPSAYVGKYFFQDLCNRWINYITPSNGAVRNPFATNIAGNALALDMGPDGNLYYLSRSDRKLYKIVYSGSEAPVIMDQPDDVTVSAGQSASFSVTASGTTPLSYQWRKNNVNIFGATGSTYTISNAQPSDAGQYSVVVSNAAGTVTSNAATLTVTSFNEAPTASITTPSAGMLYRGGDVIDFSGTASDSEDGELPASAFTWTVIFHHDDHVHDGPPVAKGVKSGSFTIPTTGETSANVFYRLYLVVSDSEGLKDTAFVDIHPRTSTISLNTNTEGLQVRLDGQPVTTPYSVVSVEGIERTVSVVSPQQLNGTTYEFDSWSNGGSQTQTIATPVEDITLTANFVEVELPAPWQSKDIGNVAAVGYASYNAGTFTVAGSGNDIWNQSDEFRYVYQPFKGDGEIVARVESITNTNAWAKAGVMIRETLDGNSKHAFAMVSATRGVAFQRRGTTGGTSTHTGVSGSAPVWVKLIRSGNTFTAYYSSNGSSWNRIGSATISMANEVYAGLAVTAHNDGTINEAIFSQVSVSSTLFSPTIYEAENAVLSGARIDNIHAGYTGTGFVDYLNSNNDYIEWTFNHSVAGSAVLEFRYALGSSSSRPLQITVNGNVVASSLSFSPTGSWTSWQTVRVSASLVQGSNVIRATAIGSSGANLDHLKVLPPNGTTNKPTIFFEPERMNVHMYPNPADQELNIYADSLLNLDKAEITLIDLVGKECFIKLLNKEDDFIRLDLSNVTSGIYILQIKQGEQLIRQKLMIR